MIIIMVKLFMIPRLYDNFEKKNGFAVLIGVLIVGAFGLAVVLYLILSGVYSYQNSFVLEQSNSAKALANACAESALSKIQLCSSTVGIGSVQIGTQACNYEIIATSEQSRIIQATAAIGTVVRKVKVSVNQVDPLVTTDAWQEVVSF